ncbi:hypothetical protein A33M_0150 [Rhodovulum sp. PH10]|uniref:hypothetical protein n=1 Tax=Rhodovulum sp. PH10 TaxID=1187851 RepID=UPI00027C207F|nr:hypothetical protein [Rhodovulum sp. PH10]EJW10364.1 hypothetical protein A33M_0150 [Rhodovulum sp. PH10]
MNEAAIHDRLAQAHNLLAGLLRADGESVGADEYDRAMDRIALLFDPKGPFHTPSMTVALPPALDRAVIELREIMERFRDATAESSEQAVRELWSVLGRREVVAELRRESETGRI